MEIRTFFIGRTFLSFLGLIEVVLCGALDGLTQRVESLDDLTDAVVSSAEAPIMKCVLQGRPRLPAFSMDADFVIGGVFFINFKVQTVLNNYTTKPEPAKCTGR